MDLLLLFQHPLMQPARPQPGWRAACWLQPRMIMAILLFMHPTSQSEHSLRCKVGFFSPPSCNAILHQEPIWKTKSVKKKKSGASGELAASLLLKSFLVSWLIHNGKATHCQSMLCAMMKSYNKHCFQQVAVLLFWRLWMSSTPLKTWCSLRHFTFIPSWNTEGPRFSAGCRREKRSN